MNDETQPLYLETYVSRIGPGAALLQTRSGTSCPRDKAPEHSILRPLHLQARACQVQKEDTATFKERYTRYTTWAQEVPSLLLCKRGQYNNRSQTTSRNLQQRHSNGIRDYNEFPLEYTRTE